MFSVILPWCNEKTNNVLIFRFGIGVFSYHPKFMGKCKFSFATVTLMFKKIFVLLSVFMKYSIKKNLYF
jgi:hypothetical protein